MNDASGIEFLRHCLATLAYRGGKTLRGAPAGFGDFVINEGTRTPLQILAHVNDVIDWAHQMVEGKQYWHDSTPRTWDDEVARFYSSVQSLDDRIKERDSLGFPPEKLFQGPIADALCHVGQIAIMRRLAGSPVKGENYFRAEIVAGNVGPEQAPPRREFD